MSIQYRFFGYLLTFALPILANAATRADLGQCVGIALDNERLACYDRISGRTEAASAEVTAAAGIPESPSHVAPAAAVSSTQDANLTPMQKAWDLAGTRGHEFEIRPYRAVYLLPLFTTSNVNSTPSSPTRQSTEVDGIRATEAKFQLSFKTKAATDLFGDNGDLWLAYTQSSRWQVYSEKISRPFRETDYEPEAIFVWRTNQRIAGVDVRYVGLGLNHQSNGRGGELSRSWNRVIAQAGFEMGDWTATLRRWHRIGESDSKDDNPNIEKYLGRGDIELTRKIGNNLLMAQMHHRLIGSGGDKGSLRIDWAFPISKGLRGHLQWFTGYGESLIDYNHKADYIGLGFSLAEPL